MPSPKAEKEKKFDLRKRKEAEPTKEVEVKAPEKAKERPRKEKKEQLIEKQVERIGLIKKKPPTVQKPPAKKSQLLVKIEKILEDELQTTVAKMPAQARKEFIQAGRQTAKTIEGLLQKAKVKAAKIVDLIKNWLKLIPGINKFFLDQEAKIMTDKILNLKKDKNK